MPPTRKKAPKPPPRRRRAPEEARREILDAAEALIHASGPDAVTLDGIARAAGVSHGLVSHYFGTYAAVVNAVLDRRRQMAREEAMRALAEPSWQPGSGALFDVFVRLCADDVFVRLGTWALLRADGPGDLLFPAEANALSSVVDAVLAQLAARTGAKLRPDARREVEWNVAVLIAATYGFALMRPALRRSLGLAEGELTWDAYAERMRGLLRQQTAAAMHRE